MPVSPKQGKIVINEIHHSPSANETKYEFLELYNNTLNNPSYSPESINISGWWFECDGAPFPTDNNPNGQSRVGICDGGGGEDYVGQGCGCNFCCYEYIVKKNVSFFKIIIDRKI